MSSLENKITKFFGNVQGVVSVHLFGSEAKKSATRSSDVDVAVLFFADNIPTVLQKIELQECLSEELNREVDLLCLNSASSIIGMQVLKYGKILLTKDTKRYDRFEMTLFTDYNDLKYLRRSMENEILKRKFYG